MSSIEKALQQAASLRELNSIGLRRSVGSYYYIAHYPPLKAQREIGKSEAVNLLDDVNWRGGVETYIHFPFCEIICSFCHFMKELKGEDFSSKEEKYLQALKREIMMHVDRVGRIPARSLQIGGGTPSLMNNKRLDELLSFVHKNFDFASEAEIKIELLPKEYDPSELREKLQILKAHGVTDLVIDLESGNTKSLKTVGRAITSLPKYLDLVSECEKAGFDSIITALMAGLPHETFESLEKTVCTLADLPSIRTINVFPTIVRDPDPIARQYKQNPGWFPTVKERDGMWVMARNTLRDKGFTEGPISYLNRSIRPSQQVDKFECVNLLGFGVSAFGYLNGDNWAAQVFNHCTFRDYYAAIETGQLPLWRSGIIDNSERARRKLIFGLANCDSEDLKTLESRFDISVDELFGQTLNALLSKNLITITEGGVQYTEKGLCRLEEISFFLGSETVNWHANQPVSHENPLRQELLRHHYYPAIPSGQQDQWRQWVEGFPKKFMWRLD